MRRKAEGPAGEQAPERWLVQPEGNDGKHGSWEVRQGSGRSACKGRVLTKAGELWEQKWDVK